MAKHIDISKHTRVPELSASSLEFSEPQFTDEHADVIEHCNPRLPVDSLSSATICESFGEHWCGAITVFPVVIDRGVPK